MLNTPTEDVYREWHLHDFPQLFQVHTGIASRIRPHPLPSIHLPSNLFTTHPTYQSYLIGAIQNIVKQIKNKHIKCEMKKLKIMI